MNFDRTRISMAVSRARWFLGTLLGLAWAAFTGCIMDRTAPEADVSGGGNGTETTVAVRGRAVDSLGGPVGGASVSLSLVTDLADSLDTPNAPVSDPPGRPHWRTVTGPDGKFSLDSIYGGVYLIEIKTAGALGPLQRLHVDPEAKRIDLSDTKLKAPGVIAGVLRLPANATGAWVGFYGSDQAVHTGPDGIFHLGGLGEGSYRLRARCGEGCNDRDVEGVNVVSGDTSSLPVLDLASEDAGDYSTWAHARTIHVRTGPLGANLAQGLSGFPLLIRLDSSSFNFAAANADGSDMRFSESGSPLPYEIESWDPIARQAAIWVRLDSLRAGDDLRSFQMHWGKAGALDRSQGSAVFGTSGRFIGVWHMHTEVGSLVEISDASGSDNTAWPQGEVAWNSLHTPAGNGLSLSGNGYLSTTRNVPVPDTATLSLWFRSSARHGGKLLGFQTYPTGAAGDFDRHLWLDDNGLIHFGVYQNKMLDNMPDSRYRVISGNVPLNDGAWHYAVAVLAVPEMRLYVDGSKVAGLSDLGKTFHYPYNGYWRIGQGNLVKWNPAPAQDYFEGEMDEVRVYYGIHSESWIRMCLENQRPSPNVLSFDP